MVARGGGGGGSRLRAPFRSKFFFFLPMAATPPFYATSYRTNERRETDYRFPRSNFKSLDIRSTPRLCSFRSVSRFGFYSLWNMQIPTSVSHQPDFSSAKLGKLRGIPSRPAGLNEFVLRIPTYLLLEPQRFSPLLRCFHPWIDSGRLSQPGFNAKFPPSLALRFRSFHHFSFLIEISIRIRS